jgi:hypothetical protein
MKTMKTMLATVFHGVNDIRVDSVPKPSAGPGEAVIKITDEQVVLLADIASTGFGGAESGGIKIGDTVVVFAQGPIGLCATVGAKLMGATLIFGNRAEGVLKVLITP